MAKRKNLSTAFDGFFDVIKSPYCSIKFCQSVRGEYCSDKNFQLRFSAFQLKAKLVESLCCFEYTETDLAIKHKYRHELTIIEKKIEVLNWFNSICTRDFSDGNDGKLPTRVCFVSHSHTTCHTKLADITKHNTLHTMFELSDRLPKKK